MNTHTKIYGALGGLALILIVAALAVQKTSAPPAMAAPNAGAAAGAAAAPSPTLMAGTMAAAVSPHASAPVPPAGAAAKNVKLLNAVNEASSAAPIVAVRHMPTAHSASRPRPADAPADAPAEAPAASEESVGTAAAPEAPAADEAVGGGPLSDDSAAPPPTPTGSLSAPVHLGDANNGETVRVGQGQRVTIRLKENRTTGYGWVLEQSGKPEVHGEAAVPPILRLVTDKSLPSEKRGMMGAPGWHVWEFEAVNGGVAHVHMAYRRPWLPLDTPPAHVYSVTLSVIPHN